MVNIEKILDPITSKVFFTQYWRKKHLVIRRNKFRDIYGFKDLNNYLNRYPYVRGLQILDYDDNDTRWCLDKHKKLNQPKLTKQQVYEHWKKHGRTFVIPFAENENKSLNDIVKALEQYFYKGQANVYASPKANSKSFPAHADATENFLFHTEGKTKWTMYSDKGKTILDKFTLDAGDLLYIPIGMYHKVETVGARILVSIHFRNKKGQNLNTFKIGKDYDRDLWYNWTPDLPKQKTKRPVRLMNKRTWSKPYFNKKI